jgi:hypothetical protein
MAERDSTQPSLPRKAAALLTLAAATLFAGPVLAQTRFDQFTRKFATTPDQARVLSAGCLGASGTVWLVGGGFQPDGTVVVAGVSLGPTLELAGTRIEVLGKDSAAPPAPQPRQQMDKDNKPVLDKAGKPKYDPFGWKHENATAFVVRLSSDLKEIKSACRFPWKAAGLSSAAVDAAGNIYLAGPATDGLRAVGGDQKELPVGKGGPEKGSCDFTYVACLAPEGGKTVWVRTFRGPSPAPVVEVDKSGNVRFQGPDVRVFDNKGEQKSVTMAPGGLGPRCALNPRDGTLARGGEKNWRTGREPYRDPVLNICKPDGKLLYELYSWDGPFVGLDNLRLVSDSAVRLVRYDEDGNLVLYAWSDGGNTVLLREPNDVRRLSKKMDGLGFSTWGANVLSCAYVIKIETKNYKIIAGTPWLAYLNNNNKPNSIWIDSLDFAGDGSICLTGNSAWGLIQTGNNLSAGAEPAGPYVSVLSKDCTSLRFSSVMPACGKTELGEGARWGVVRGTVNGKARLLFLCGAVEKEEIYGKTLAAPQLNPLQGKYGGGQVDGYMLLLDLASAK